MYVVAVQKSSSHTLHNPIILLFYSVEIFSIGCLAAFKSNYLRIWSNAKLSGILVDDF